MQPKTFLVIFCTILVLFIGLNNGTPTEQTTTKQAATNQTTTTKQAASKLTTTKKPTTTKIQKTTPATKQILVGGHTPWDKNIKPKHKKIFDDYKKITLKKLQEVHKVPKSFNPKPEKFSTQVVGGINYLYLVKLPINKYAFVSIHDRAWIKGHYGKEENVLVRPQTYELNDKTV